MIDAIRLTFAALREAARPPVGDLNVRALGQGPGGVYLALDAERRAHLLVEAEVELTGSTGLTTVTIGHRDLVVDGRTAGFLDVTCEAEELAEVFDHFVAAVTQRLLSSGDSPVEVVLDVIEHWRQFLVSEAPPAGRDRLAAVFGELLVVLDVVRADPRGRVDCWVGPFGGRHDLRRGTRAVEVKTTRAHTTRVVTVHGEDQLVEPDGGSLHLHLVRLEEVPEGGASVPSLVDDLLAAGAPAQELFKALDAAGVAPAELPAVNVVRFDVRERMTVRVDERTPRLVPSSFVSGARPIGIVDLVYRVDLDHVLEAALDDDSVADLIRELATARGE